MNLVKLSFFFFLVCCETHSQSQVIKDDRKNVNKMQINEIVCLPVYAELIELKLSSLSRLMLFVSKNKTEETNNGSRRKRKENT